MAKLTYTCNGDYLILDIKFTNTESLGYSKYACMREPYLKEKALILYNDLVLTEQLLEKHLVIDKLTQQFVLVQHMNILKAQAEENYMCRAVYK